MNKGRGRCRERRYRKSEGEKSGFPGSDVERERGGEWREGWNERWSEQ